MRVTVRVSSVSMFYGKHGNESFHNLSLCRHRSKC